MCVFAGVHQKKLFTTTKTHQISAWMDSLKDLLFVQSLEGPQAISGGPLKRDLNQKSFWISSNQPPG